MEKTAMSIPKPTLKRIVLLICITNTLAVEPYI